MKRHNITWTADFIEDRLDDAAFTLRRLPKQKVQGYISTWPEIVYTARELLQHDKPVLRLGPPLPAAIDRMDECLSWLCWCTEYERKLLWMRAERLRWKVICQYFGVERTTVYRHRKVALERIAALLNGKQHTKNTMQHLQQRQMQRNLT